MDLKKRFLSILLTLVMVLSLLPMSIFATEPITVQWKGAMNYNDSNNVVGSLGEKTPTSKDYTVESWYTVADEKGYPSTQVIIGDYLYCYNGKLVKYDLNGNKVAESEAFGTPNSIGWYEYLTATDDGEYIFVTFSGTTKDYVIKVSDLSVALETDKLENSSYPTAQFHNGYLFCNGNIYKFETSPEVKLTKVGTKIGTRTVNQTIDETQKEVTFTMTFAWSTGAFVKHGESQAEWFYVTGYDNNKAKTTGTGANKKTTQEASENYQKGILYAVDYATGEVKDTFIPETSWLKATTTTGQVTYDSVSGYLYWGSYSEKKMFAIKLKADGTFDDDTYTSVELNQVTVCSPIIINGRAYLAGNSGYINVVNVDPSSVDFMKLIYTSSNQIYKIQSNPIAFVDVDENVYIYVQSYVASGHLYCLKDTKTSNQGALELIATPSQLVSYDAETFSGSQAGAFAYEQICRDAQGRIYVVNDTGYLYCFEKAPVKVPSITADLSSDYVKYNMLNSQDTVEELSVAAISHDDGVISYQWQKSSDKITWTNILGENTATYTPAKEIGHFYYRCKITNTKEGQSASAFSKNADVEVKNFSSDKTVQYILTSSNTASGTKQDLKDGQTILFTSAQTKYRIWLDAPENGSITLTKVSGSDTFTEAKNQSNYEYRIFCSTGVKDADAFEIAVTAEDGSTEKHSFIVAPDTLVNTEKLVTVSAIAQKSGSIVYVTDGALTVGSKTAEDYGYVDKINYMVGVSSLDTLVTLHKEIYGNIFSSATAINYLVVGNDGTISKIFGVNTGNVGFAVNEACPNDGTASPWGGYNGLTVNQVKVNNSDKLEFFVYQDSWGQDTYTYIESQDEIEANTELNVTVSGICYGWTGYLYKDATEMKLAATTVASVSIGAVNIKTGEITYLTSTDSNGNAKCIFEQSGTYYLTAYGTSNDVPVLMTLKKVVILPCVHEFVDDACSKCGAVKYTIKAAPTTVNVSFEDQELIDNGVVGKYHQYTLIAKPGKATYSAIDGTTDLGTGVLITGSSSASFNLVRANIYVNSADFKNEGDFTVTKFENKTDSTVYQLGTPYINSKLYTSGLLLTEKSYGGEFTFKSDFLDDYYQTGSWANFTISATATTVQNKSLPVAAYKKFVLIVPSDAEKVEFFNQTANFVVSALDTSDTTPGSKTCLTVTDNGNGTKTYTLKSKSVTYSTQYTWRVTKSGKTTLAGYMTNGKTITASWVENEPTSTVSVPLQEGRHKDFDYDDNSVLLNIDDTKDTNELVMKVGDNFKLRAFRNGWEIVDNVSNNKMIEPDFHFSIISGNDVVSVVPVTDKVTGNASANWMNITALKEGVAVIAVWYDGIHILGSTQFDGFYGATDPARYGYVVINVGIDTTIDIAPVSASKTWDAEFDTVYYLNDDGGVFKFSSTSATAVSVTNYYGTVVGTKSAVTKDADGYWNVPVFSGSNLITIESESGTDYRFVRANKVSLILKNNTKGTVSNDPANFVVEIGDSVTVSFDKFNMPVPKMSGIYNPGFQGTCRVIYEIGNNSLVLGNGTQYNLPTSTYCAVTFVACENGDVTLKNGYISSNVLGDKPGNHRNITDAGRQVNTNAGSSTSIFSQLPEVTIHVNDGSLSNEQLTTLSAIDIKIGEKNAMGGLTSRISSNLSLSNTSVTWKSPTANSKLYVKPQAYAYSSEIKVEWWYVGDTTKSSIVLTNGIETEVGGFAANKDKQLNINIVVTPSSGAAATYSFTVNENKHTLVHHEAVAATTTSEGNTEYWECTGCGKYYSDASGTVEIAENSWITPKIVIPPVTPDETDIIVYITVFGDTEHGDEGTRHTLSAGNLTTWVSRRAVTVEDKATVWDAMQQLSSDLDGAITYTNPSGNYFSAVTYNGTTLGEIDNGALSGWMYTLNGKHPNLGVSEQKLSDGDEIVIHYTDDYTNEEGSESWNDPTPVNPTPSDDKKDDNKEEQKPVVKEDVIVNSYTDIKEDNWFADYVLKAFKLGLMEGVGNNKFNPYGTFSRAMIVMVLYRLEGQPAISTANTFKDVPTGMWYTEAVEWAAANKIVDGIGDGKYNPNATLSRQDMATILMRYAKFKGYDVTKSNDLSSYVDADHIVSWAVAAMKWANAEGLIEGYGNKINPTSGATRAEAATILVRFVENVVK